MEGFFGAILDAQRFGSQTALPPDPKTSLTPALHLKWGCYVATRGGRAAVCGAAALCGPGRTTLAGFCMPHTSHLPPGLSIRHQPRDLMTFRVTRTWQFGWASHGLCSRKGHGQGGVGGWEATFL